MHNRKLEHYIDSHTLRFYVFVFCLISSYSLKRVWNCSFIRGIVKRIYLTKAESNPRTQSHVVATSNPTRPFEIDLFAVILWCANTPPPSHHPHLYSSVCSSPVQYITCKQFVCAMSLLARLWIYVPNGNAYEHASSAPLGAYKMTRVPTLQSGYYVWSESEWNVFFTMITWYTSSDAM